MSLTTETIQVAGVRCERCVMRLGTALEGHDGLEAATANLMGEVTLTWDESRTSREYLIAVAMAGYLAQGKHAEARALWERYGPTRVVDAGLELRLFYALAHPPQ